VSDRWRNNWHAVSPADAVCVDLVRSAAGRRALGQTLRGLQPGTAVVLRATGPSAQRRCRRLAADARVELECEYLAFPSPATPAYLVEAAPAPIGLFVRSLLVAPPRSAASVPIEAALSLIRALKLWRVVPAIAPGCVAVGRRA
jgi:hypothetical protein